MAQVNRIERPAIQRYALCVSHLTMQSLTPTQLPDFSVSPYLCGLLKHHRDTETQRRNSTQHIELHRIRLTVSGSELVQLCGNGVYQFANPVTRGGRDRK